MANGGINTRNLMTIVSVAILVGTEIFGLALAAGWAIAGLFQLGLVIERVLMAAFGLVGAYALYRFVQGALAAEPIRD
ncbi:hypothetical protein [Alsobacter ponti]